MRNQKFRVAEAALDKIFRVKADVQKENCGDGHCGSGEERSPNLQKICRTVTRNHLLQVDQYLNLFVRIPQLPLPRLLQEFLLYNISVETEEEEDSDDECSSSDSDESDEE